MIWRFKFSTIMVLQFIVVWLFCARIPKETYKAIFVGEIVLFTLYIFFNWHRFYNTIKRTKELRTISYLFFFLFALSGILLGLSYYNLADFWHLNFILFDKEYIYRHFLIIAELLLPIGLSIAIVKSNIILEVKSKHLLFLFIISSILFYIYSNQRIFLSELVIFSATLYAFKSKRKWFSIVILFVLRSHSAYVLAGFVTLTLIFLKEIIQFAFNKNVVRRFTLLLLAVALLVYIFYDELFQIILDDKNFLWRWEVWTNEIKTLIQTNFTGVGFGTSYVTTDFFNDIDNDNMYTHRAQSYYDRLFVVANHNSFLNMFYRLGAVGGVLFIILNIVICAACTNDIDSKKSMYNAEIRWWAFCNYIYQIIIIFTNPGMEMMQFAINYTFSLGIILSVILRVNMDKINAKLEPWKPKCRL